MIDAPPTHNTIQGFLSGATVAAGADGQVLAAMVATVPAQIRLVAASCGTAGGSTSVIDVRINGTSVWTNTASRLTLSGAAAGKYIAGRINRSAVRQGDIVSLVLVTAGAKTNVTATVALEEP